MRTTITTRFWLERDPCATGRSSFIGVIILTTLKQHLRTAAVRRRQSRMGAEPNDRGNEANLESHDALAY